MQKSSLITLLLTSMKIEKKVSPALIIGVVKADSYGHGAVKVAKRLIKEGCNFFAVAVIGRSPGNCRESGISEPILVFGRLFPDEIPRKAVNSKASGIRSLFGQRKDIKLGLKKAHYSKTWHWSHCCKLTHGGTWGRVKKFLAGNQGPWTFSEMV